MAFAAAMPEANAKACVPPSSSERADSNFCRVGLPSLEYINPAECSPWSSLAYVVAICMEGERARLSRSGSVPTRAAIVSKLDFILCKTEFRA